MARDSPLCKRWRKQLLCTWWTWQSPILWLIPLTDNINSRKHQKYESYGWCWRGANQWFWWCHLCQISSGGESHQVLFVLCWRFIETFTFFIDALYWDSFFPIYIQTWEDVINETWLCWTRPLGRACDVFANTCTALFCVGYWWYSVWYLWL